MAMEPHFSRVVVVVVFMSSEIISCWTTVKPVFSVPDILSGHPALSRHERQCKTNLYSGDTSIKQTLARVLLVSASYRFHCNSTLSNHQVVFFINFILFNCSNLSYTCLVYVTWK